MQKKWNLTDLLHRLEVQHKCKAAFLLGSLRNTYQVSLLKIVQHSAQKTIQT